jgi:hypothetical protein
MFLARGAARDDVTNSEALERQAALPAGEQRTDANAERHRPPPALQQ